MATAQNGLQNTQLRLSGVLPMPGLLHEWQVLSSYEASTRSGGGSLPRRAARISRRLLRRCRFDQASIQAPRVFCQNSGACGSTYLIRLLEANGISRCFHEKTPDLDATGVTHYESPLSDKRLVRILRYTRHDCWLEASNRLFSMSLELKAAFPQSRFIHLHRHAADAVRSAMSKPDLEKYLANSVRFQGTLAGPHDAEPFERFCHYWANVNRRIAEDLDILDEPTQRLSLRFADLTAGRIESLEVFLDVPLPVRTIPPANVGRTGNLGRFPAYADWTRDQRSMFFSICGPVLDRLGYPIEPE